MNNWHKDQACADLLQENADLYETGMQPSAVGAKSAGQDNIGIGLASTCGRYDQASGLDPGQRNKRMRDAAKAAAHIRLTGLYAVTSE